jgi:alkanesulfonate monooxygenase SsuD/methylene tetrahydromethanopterin reductase-like flavin-dependent oxidoreductase (luciferase family)
LLPPLEARRSYAAHEQSELQQLRRQALVGAAPVVAQRLQDLAVRLQVDELAIITWTYEPQARKRSYELLAQAFGLGL